MSFGRKIAVGLVLGLATGLFLGDLAAPLQVVATAFLRLLQMTVLPYVTVSLVLGIGSLDPASARRLFVRVGALTVLLWTLALACVFLMPLAFPALQSAAFFSTTLVETPPPADFLALYVPSNPFHSLANGVVPAVLGEARLRPGVAGLRRLQPQRALRQPRRVETPPPVDLAALYVPSQNRNDR